MDFESRLQEAINEFRMADRGTLWFVKDSVWEMIIEEFEKKRVGHPGLVISRRKFKSLQDTVTMMIGSSRYTGGSFYVKDVMPNVKEKKKLTFFKAFKPCPLPPEGDSPLAIENFTGRSDEIRRNDDKPSLDQDEMKQLNIYIKAKRISL